MYKTFDSRMHDKKVNLTIGVVPILVGMYLDTTISVKYGVMPCSNKMLGMYFLCPGIPIPLFLLHAVSLYLCPPITRPPPCTRLPSVWGVKVCPGGFEPPLQAAPQNRCGDKPSLPQPTRTCAGLYLPARGCYGKKNQWHILNKDEEKIPMVLRES